LPLIGNRGRRAIDAGLDQHGGLAAKTQRGYDQSIGVIEAWSAHVGHPPLTTINRKV
jgi:hypothetical protein